MSTYPSSLSNNSINPISNDYLSFPKPCVLLLYTHFPNSKGDFRNFSHFSLFFFSSFELRHRLAHEYGITTDFTELWDRLQHEGLCCGITESQVRRIMIFIFIYTLY